LSSKAIPFKVRGEAAQPVTAILQIIISFYDLFLLARKGDEKITAILFAKGEGLNPRL
jgi:hypothetical protein